jgi:FG-GAP repeat
MRESRDRAVDRKPPVYLLGGAMFKCRHYSAISFSLLMFLGTGSSAIGQASRTAPGPQSQPAVYSQLAKITALDGVDRDQFGFCTALVGKTLFASAPFATIGGNAGQGAVYVYLEPASGWSSTSAYVAKLTASDGQGNDNFGGGAIAVSADGNTLAVGACGQNHPCVNGTGKAYVFVKPATGWTDMTETARLSASDALAANGFGQSVGISADTVIIGAPIENVGSNIQQGAAYVYVKPTAGWISMTETAKLTSSDGRANDIFGEVSAGASGSIVFVGAPNAIVNGARAGAGYIFVRPTAGWQTTSTFAAKLTSTDAASGDGLGVAPQWNGLQIFGAGKAYVFVKPAAGWTNMTETAKLTARDENYGDAFGWSVAINNNGTAVIGAVRANALMGKAYIYSKPLTGWKTTSQFRAGMTGSDTGPNDWFGYSVALSGATSVMGARANPSSPTKGYGPGATYIFGP